MSEIPLNKYRDLAGAAYTLLDAVLKHPEKVDDAGAQFTWRLAEVYGVLPVLDKMNELADLIGQGTAEEMLAKRNNYKDPLGSAAVFVSLVIVLPGVKAPQDKMAVELLDVAAENFLLACLDDSGLSKDDFLAVLGKKEEADVAH